MARPEIGFTLTHEGRRQLAVQPGQDQPMRVAALLGADLADNCVAVDFAREAVRLAGVAGLPTYNRGVADHQLLFVNGRPVKDRLLVVALRASSDERRAGRECVSTCRSRWSA